MEDHRSRMGKAEGGMDLQDCGFLIKSRCCRSCQQSKGHLPMRLPLLKQGTATRRSSKWLFCLHVNRTPSVIKILHGMRGRKHRLAKHPVSCRSRLSVRYWTKPLVHGWDKQEVERIAGLGCARQGTSRSDPCWVR